MKAKAVRGLSLTAFFCFNCPYKNRFHPYSGWRAGIRSAPPLTFGVEFVPGVINDGLHKTILSDGILPQQNKTEKILSDKIVYV